MNNKMDSNIRTISMQKLTTRLVGGQGMPPQADINIKPNDSFYICKEKNEKYIEPLLTNQILPAGTDFKDAQIVLISAPGATGKSAMTKFLSNSLNIPIFDLGKHEPVGSYSFLGMLYKTLETADMVSMLSGLSDGRRSIIVDALDEGNTKTGQGAFDSFLNDLAEIAFKSNGLPFVIFGRSSVLEYTALYLEEQHVKTVLLQIEPFTIKQANEFIDKQMEEKAVNRFEESYKALKEYIIDAINGFFKNESDIKKHLFERFIGYAPVLLSIVELFKENKDYHSLLLNLQNSKAKHIDLIIRILEMILEREKSKLETPLKELLKGRSKEFCDDVYLKAYSIEEQCVRLLKKKNKKAHLANLTQDPDFNQRYNEIADNWVKEHPFIDTEGRFVNIVFESYVIVRLAYTKDWEDALEYLKQGQGSSYLFFELFKTIKNTESDTDYRMIPYLMESFQSTDRTDNKGEIEITASDIKEKPEGTLCEVAFYRKKDSRDDTILSLQIHVPDKQKLEMPSLISNITIDAPIHLEFSTPRIEISAPVSLDVNSIDIHSKEIILRGTSNNESIVMECQRWKAQTPKGSIQDITQMGNCRAKIVTNDVLYFPFIEYHEDVQTVFNDDNDLYEKYQKLRKILIQFRANSKGILAKYKDKIDNRIGCHPTGKKVLRALLSNKIIDMNENMYFLNMERFEQILGLNFSQLRSYELNDATISFLQNIK